MFHLPNRPSSLAGGYPRLHRHTHHPLRSLWWSWEGLGPGLTRLRNFSFLLCLLLQLLQLSLPFLSLLKLEPSLKRNHFTVTQGHPF